MKSKKLISCLLILGLTFSPLTSVYGIENQETDQSIESVENTATSMTETTDSDVFLAQGEFGTSRWELSQDQVLTIYSGEFEETKGESPWIQYKDEIKKIVFDDEVLLNEESSHLFEGLTQVTTIENIHYLKIVPTTRMNNFFEGCTNLKELDFSEWDTRNVSENDQMFSECTSLEKISVGEHSVLPLNEEILNEESNKFWIGENPEEQYRSLVELFNMYTGLQPNTFYLRELDEVEGKVIVQYLNEDGEEIHESKEVTGTLSTTFDVTGEEYQLVIEGYVLDTDKLPQNAIGEFSETDEIVQYFYKKVMTEKPVDIGTPSISYSTHVQDIGWQSYKKDGEINGTTGKAKQLEGLKIKLTGVDAESGIQYRSHIQDSGWECDYHKNDELSGTTGRALQMEGLQIQLTGLIAQSYDVYYRVHTQHLGWLNWAKNGEIAGTTRMFYQLEAVQIQLVKKNISGPSGRGPAYVSLPIVSYRAHVQDIGWQNYVQNGAQAGTTGKAKQLESIQIHLKNQDFTGNIQYRSFVQNSGWENEYLQNDGQSGTTGRALRLEAIQIRLTGDLSKYFDVYYRVHCQNFGWLGWAKNGASAGTEGYFYQLEGLQVKIVPKEGTVPGPTVNAFKKRPTVSSYMGTNRNRVVSELLAHQNDWYYLQTPFRGLANNRNAEQYMSPRGNPNGFGPGMNCTGFVAYVMRRAGGQHSAITRVANQWGGIVNGYNWRDALVQNVTYYTFNSVRELLNSGKAAKGDIIYFEANWSLPNADCHLGFFWGNKPNEDVFWHSTYPSNQISNIRSGTPYSKLYLFKM